MRKAIDILHMPFEAILGWIDTLKDDYHCELLSIIFKDLKQNIIDELKAEEMGSKVALTNQD